MVRQCRGSSDLPSCTVLLDGGASKEWEMQPGAWEMELLLPCPGHSTVPLARLGGVTMLKNSRRSGKRKAIRFK